MAERIDLGEDDRRTLVVREAPHVANQIAQILANLHLAGEPFGGDLRELCSGALPPCPQHRVAPVASDSEQPCPEVDLLIRAEQVVVCGEKSLLHRVLGFLRVAEHVAAEGKDAAVMAGVHHLEGTGPAFTDQID